VDYPNNSEDYVHRIGMFPSYYNVRVSMLTLFPLGRTGRAGTTGTAVTFFTADNSKQARDLVTVLT